MLYRFRQNNSWWHLTINDTICQLMIIEANNKDEALDIAESLWIYFDWVNCGIDCECCWDRWDEYPDEISFPYQWDKDNVFNTVEEYVEHLNNNYSKNTTRVFYLDGTIKSFNF